MSGKAVWWISGVLFLGAVLADMGACEDHTHLVDDLGDASDSGTDGDSDADTDTVVPVAAVSGTVGRDVSTCPPGQDGIGNLCLFLLEDCDDFGSDGASANIAGVDMSVFTNTVPFEITEVPDGNWYLYGFLDDDGSGCDGDVTSGDFWEEDCIEVIVEDQTNVTGIEFIFWSKCP